VSTKGCCSGHWIHFQTMWICTDNAGNSVVGFTLLVADRRSDKTWIRGYEEISVYDFVGSVWETARWLRL